MNIIEEHKVVAFKGVVKGKDTERWKSKVESINSYDALLQKNHWHNILQLNLLRRVYVIEISY